MARAMSGGKLGRVVAGLVGLLPLFAACGSSDSSSKSTSPTGGVGASSTGGSETGGAATCELGEFQCTGDELAACRATQDGFYRVLDCPAGTCNAVDGRCDESTGGAGGESPTTTGGAGEGGVVTTGGAGTGGVAISGGSGAGGELATGGQAAGGTGGQAAGGASTGGGVAAGGTGAEGGAPFCERGDFQCSGSVLRACLDTQDAFYRVATCPSGLCDPVGGQCDVCEAGLATCLTGVRLEVCSPDGQELGTVNCSGSTPYCAGGSCVECRSPNDCPAPTQCRVAICTDGVCGVAPDPSPTACTSGGDAGTCSGGTCRVCTPGALRCSPSASDTPQQCDATGVWVDEAPCPGTGYRCLRGACESCDLDDDGFDGAQCSGEDCNDEDSSIHPRAGDVLGDGVDSDCDGGDCEAASLGGTYFAACEAYGTWSECEALCAASGLAIASVRSQAEQDFVYDLIVNSSFGGADPTKFFIGFNDVAAEGTWVWDDGHTGTYTHWDAGEPNNQNTENCGLLDADPAARAGAWLDGRCSTDQMCLCSAH